MQTCLKVQRWISHGPRNNKWCTRIEKYFNVWLALGFFFLFCFEQAELLHGNFFFSIFILLLNPCWVTRNIVVVYLSCCSLVFSYKSRILLCKLLIESFFKFIPTHGLIETCAISILLLPAAMWWTTLQILLFLESFVSVLLSWKRGLKCD